LSASVKLIIASTKRLGGSFSFKWNDKRMLLGIPPLDSRGLFPSPAGQLPQNQDAKPFGSSGESLIVFCLHSI